jgi:hypothetical protein
LSRALPDNFFVKNCPAEFDKAVTSSVVSDTRSLTGSFYSVAMRKDSQTELLCQLDGASTKVHLAVDRPTTVNTAAVLRGRRNSASRNGDVLILGITWRCGQLHAPAVLSGIAPFVTQETGGPQRRSGFCGKEKFRSYRESKPVCQPVAIHCSF